MKQVKCCICNRNIDMTYNDDNNFITRKPIVVVNPMEVYICIQCMTTVPFEERDRITRKLYEDTL